MDDDDDTPLCPLCVEEIDQADKNFLPCPCGYQVCMWCWHHIRENLNGLCPACRTPYSADPHAFSAVDRQEVVKKNREKKQKEKQEKKVTDKPVVAPPPKPVAVDRKHLHNYRVVQRNLVYVIGLPNGWSSEDLLRRAEYFGQYGKINKVVVHRTSNVGHATVSAYITFAHKEDAKASIAALDGFWIDGHPLRASFGTTKYCNNFIRNMPCNNPDCVYLHDLGDEDDRFTKEEIQAGHTKLTPTPGRDQVLVTGNGGPSGTGRRPMSDPVLPAPVFLQDLPKLTLSRASSAPSTTSGRSTDQPACDADAAKIAQVDDTHEIKEYIQSIEPAVTPSAAPTIIPEPMPIAAPVAAPIAPRPVASRPVAKPLDPRLFNGLCSNAVFPVPSSSLSMSVWSTVLQASTTDLHVNPFAQLAVSFSVLLELTLPPVDLGWSAHRPELLHSVSAGPVLISSGMAPGVNGPASLSQLRQIFPGVNLVVAPGAHAQRG